MVLIIEQVLQKKINSIITTSSSQTELAYILA